MACDDDDYDDDNNNNNNNRFYNLCYDTAWSRRNRTSSVMSDIT